MSDTTTTALVPITFTAAGILENPESKDIAQFESGISLVEEYLSFDPNAAIPQTRRLFFLEIGERESRDEKGDSLGMKPAAVFIDPVAERFCYGQQAKLVGVCKAKANAEKEEDRLLPGTAVELVFLGVKPRRRAAGHYQDFDILPLRAKKA